MDSNAQLQSGNRNLIIGDNPAWNLGIFLHLGSRSLKHLRYLSYGGGYPRWTHIQFRLIQIFVLFYFYSFNIVFEDKPSAVLNS